MKLPRFERAAPRSIAAASRLLAAKAGEAHVLAGGTDLLVALGNRQKRAGLVVDLFGIPSLDRLDYSAAGGLAIGALVSLRRLAADPRVTRGYPALAQAALAMGTVQLQAMGTVAGNLCQDTCCMYFNRSEPVRASLSPCHKLGGELCHVVDGSGDCWATYSGDLAPALLVLGARVMIGDADGERAVPLADLFSRDGRRPHTLRPGQIVTRILVPPAAPRSGSVYLKLRQRQSLDYPLLGVAARVTLGPDDGVCTQAAVALTAVDRAPVVVEEAGRLEGRLASDALMAEVAQAAYRRAQPVKNVCGLAVRYRRHMVKPYVTSALQQAVAMARGTGSRG